jgi:hypothetical protein
MLGIMRMFTDDVFRREGIVFRLLAGRRVTRTSRHEQEAEAGNE